MAYRLLAIDLDETLLAGSNEVSDANRAALTRAEESGCRVAICTGRGRFTTRPVSTDLGLLSAPHILFSGATTFLALTAAPSEVLILPQEAAAECVALADGMEVGLSGFEDPRRGDTVYLAQPTPGLRRWAERNLARAEWVARAEDILRRDLVAFLFWGGEEETTALRTCLGRPAGLAPPRIASSLHMESHVVELSAEGATKGEALARLAQRLGLRREEIVAVGDAEPDIGMIEYAGLGVAVGNASAEVKAVADYVAPCAAEDAVAHLVERFILGRGGRGG